MSAFYIALTTLVIAAAAYIVLRHFWLGAHWLIAARRCPSRPAASG